MAKESGMVEKSEPLCTSTTKVEVLDMFGWRVAEICYAT